MTGWGTKVIDRLAHDLQASFPEMTGLSPRNLKYMRAFAAAWPDAQIVQRTVARLPWRQNIALLECLDDPRTRLWYAEQTIRRGWSQPILRLQIDQRVQAHPASGRLRPGEPGGAQWILATGGGQIGDGEERLARSLRRRARRDPRWRMDVIQAGLREEGVSAAGS